MADSFVHQANWPAVKKICTFLFDYKNEFFRYIEVQFKKFCPPVKRQTSAENVEKTLGLFHYDNSSFYPSSLLTVNTMMISMIENI